VRCVAAAAGEATSRPIAPGMPAAPYAQRNITRSSQVPRRGMLGREGQGVRGRHSQVPKLSRPPPNACERMPEGEGGQA
jgi:hypothetical protein